MAELEPLPPPLQRPLPALDRMRGLIWWGIVMSLALHFVIAPLLGSYKPPVAEKSEPDVMSVSQKIKVIPPTPPPTPKPTPPPTPPPKKVVVQATAPPQRAAAIKLNVPKTKSKPVSQTNEKAYVAPAVGSENGAPGGVGASAPAVVSGGAPVGAPSAAPAPPPPTPTPKPACATPDHQAQMTHGVEPDYPETARELGATGSVDIKVTLSTTGAVTAASVARSSGNRALDLAALRAAQASSYEPDVVNCVPTAGSYLFHTDFTG